MKPKFTMILTLLALGVQFVFAQQKTVSGTTTDFDRKFQLNVNTGDVLEISYVGYATQSVTVGASSNYDVQMQPDNTLEEVVVTALGISKSEKAIGYAIQTVDGEKLTEAKETNIVNALQGRIAGVQIQVLEIPETNPNRGHTQHWANLLIIQADRPILRLQ